MKRTTLAAVGLACLMYLAWGHCVFAGGLFGRYPSAMLTIKAVDEEGMPLPDMPVRVWLAEDPVRVGKTDRNGLFVVKGECTFKDVPIRIAKSGYYPTDFKYEFPDFIEPSAPRWEPWNPVVTAVVRRVVNPIPMYAKRVETMLPATNRLCGFDLMMGDWVAPEGVGQKGDVFFWIERAVDSRQDFTLTFRVVFTNKHDGFQPAPPLLASAFSSPRFAPTSGFQTHYERKLGRRSGTGFFNIEPSQEEYGVFRVRTECNELGEIRVANYGKFTKGFEITGYLAEKPTIIFTYCLNPTPNERNLEFDPNRNLFKNLRGLERVKDP